MGFLNFLSGGSKQAPRPNVNDDMEFRILSSGNGVPEFDSSAPDSDFKINFESVPDPEPEVSGDLTMDPYSAVISRAYEYFTDRPFDVFIIEKLAADFKDIPDEATRNALIRKNLETYGIDLNVVIDELKFRKSTITTAWLNYMNQSEKVRNNISSQILKANAFIERLNICEQERTTLLSSESESVNFELERLSKMLYTLTGK